MSRRDAQNRRYRMWKQYPYCDICDEEMIVIDFNEWREKHGKQKPWPTNAAVLFCRYTHYWPTEWRERNNSLALVCHGCATKVGKEREHAVPLETRQEAAKAYPGQDRKFSRDRKQAQPEKLNKLVETFNKRSLHNSLG